MCVLVVPGFSLCETWGQINSWPGFFVCCWHDWVHIRLNMNPTGVIQWNLCVSPKTRKEKRKCTDKMLLPIFGWEKKRRVGCRNIAHFCQRLTFILKNDDPNGWRLIFSLRNDSTVTDAEKRRERLWSTGGSGEGGLDYRPSWPPLLSWVRWSTRASLPGVSLHFHPLFPVLSEPVPGGVTTMMASPMRRSTGGGCSTWRRRWTVRGSARTGSSAWWDEVGRRCDWRRLRAVNIRVTVSIPVSETFGKTCLHACANRY